MGQLVPAKEEAATGRKAAATQEATTRRRAARPAATKAARGRAAHAQPAAPKEEAVAGGQAAAAQEGAAKEEAATGQEDALAGQAAAEGAAGEQAGLEDPVAPSPEAEAGAQAEWKAPEEGAMGAEAGTSEPERSGTSLVGEESLPPVSTTAEPEVASEDGVATRKRESAKILHAARAWLKAPARKNDTLMIQRSVALGGLTKEEIADFVEANLSRIPGQWCFTVVDDRISARKQLETEPERQAETLSAPSASAPPAARRRRKPEPAPGPRPELSCLETVAGPRRRFAPLKPGTRSDTRWAPSAPAAVVKGKGKGCLHSSVSKRGCAMVCEVCGEELLYDGWKMESMSDLDLYNPPVEPASAFAAL